jgi:hypothetical protein
LICSQSCYLVHVDANLLHDWPPFAAMTASVPCGAKLATTFGGWPLHPIYAHDGSAGRNRASCDTGAGRPAARSARSDVCEPVGTRWGSVCDDGRHRDWEDGSCQLRACRAHYDDCNDAAADGCETRTTTLPDCGGCGVVCPSGEHSRAVCHSETLADCSLYPGEHPRGALSCSLQSKSACQRAGHQRDDLAPASYRLPRRTSRSIEFASPPPGTPSWAEVSCCGAGRDLRP